MLAACSVVGPDFQRKPTSLTSSYAFAPTPAQQAAAQEHWWRILDDPALDALMHEGLRSNLDIRTAQARIAESAALLRAEGGRDAQASGTLAIEVPRVVLDGSGNTIGAERATLNGNFVFDLFGQALRRRQQATRALNAATFEAESTRLAYQADLAGAVIDARFFQAAIRSTDLRIRTRTQILALTRQLLERGQLTRQDIVRAEADLASTQADLPSLRSGLHLSALRVATLLDAPVGPILARLKATEGTRQPVPSQSQDVGVPADLLRNRPDVLAAEYRLSAAFAAIGVAEADLYPALSLNGSILLDGSEQFILGPRLSVPILGRGRLLARRDATMAQADQAELAWRATIRGAVSDVERALVSMETARAEIAAFGRARDRFDELLRISRETLEIGASTVLEILDAEQDIRQVDLNLIQARRDLALAAAQLAVATGRGHGVRIAPGADPRPGDPVAAPIAPDVFVAAK